MADVKWIKLSTGIFDNRKIRQIECLPDGDSIIIVWVKLLCLAGEINDCGMIYFTKEIPYTDQMLAQQFNRPLTTIQLALNTFQQFGMVELVDDILHISNWEKYQNIEGMEKIREQNRLRQKKWYDKQKALPNVSPNVSVTQPNATDIDKNKKENKTKKENKSKKEIQSKSVRHRYGEYNHVLLSDEEMQKLKTQFSDWEDKIRNLDEYIERTGKNYKNHLLTIKTWARKDGEANKPATPEKKSWAEVLGVNMDD